MILLSLIVLFLILHGRTTLLTFGWESWRYFQFWAFLIAIIVLTSIYLGPFIS